MKTENLSKGLVIKNYSAMCELLETEQKAGGKSKSIQLEDWRRYFEYHKKGQKFVIDEIYTTPLESTKTMGRPSVYGNMVQLLILDLLGKSHGTITISANKLMEAIGMTNENYGKCQDESLGLASYSGMEVGHIYDFYNTTGSGFRKVIVTALDNLEKKMIVNYSKVVKVKERNSFTPRIATDEEVELLMTLSKDILDEMGFDNIGTVRRSNRWGEYLKKKKKALNEKTKFEYDYNAYKIVVNRKHLEKEKMKLTNLILDEEVFNKEKSELNSLMFENTIDNAKNRVENIDKTSDKLANLRSKVNYIDNIVTLCRLTIKSDASSIYNVVHDKQIKILEDINKRKQENKIDSLM